MIATVVPFALFRLFSFVETAGGMGVATGALAAAGASAGAADGALAGSAADSRGGGSPGGSGASGGSSSAVSGGAIEDATQARMAAAGPAGMAAAAAGGSGGGGTAGGSSSSGGGLGARLAPLAAGYLGAARLAGGLADHLASTGVGDGHGGLPSWTWVRAVRRIATPPARHAAWVSPEQSHAVADERERERVSARCVAKQRIVVITPPTPAQS